MTVALMKQPLDLAQKAEIYLQLARMAETGFSPAQAFDNLAHSHHKLVDQFNRIKKHLASGQTIAESGYRAGIFSRIDQRLLRAGENSGTLDQIYRRLADYYEQKSRRNRQIKNRLYFPFFILLLALFIQPFPELILGKLQITEYLWQIFVNFFRIFIALLVFWNLPKWLTEGRLAFLNLKNTVYVLQLNLPFVATWVIRRQINEFLNLLGLMLEAGLPAQDALMNAAQTVKNGLIRQHIERQIPAISGGGNVADTLANVAEIEQSTIRLIHIGEQSGKLAATLLRFCRLEYETINLQEKALAEWLPRIVYLMIAVWMGYSIVTGMPVTSLPDELK